MLTPLTIDKAFTRLGKIPFDLQINRVQAVYHFLQFVESFKVFKELPPVQWFDGPHNYRSILLDQNIFYRDDPRFLDALFTRQRSPLTRFEFPRQQLTLDLLAPSGMTSNAVGPFLYTDPNYLQALESGLGFWIVCERAIVLFPKPILRFFQETTPPRHVLHSTVAPAVEYPNQPESNQYYYRGTPVPAFVITNPERITSAHIKAARSRQVRNAMIDRYGLLRYAQERGYQRIDVDEENGVALWVTGGKRYWRGYGDGPTISQRRCILEMINATPGPDGTRQHFARRVPGTTQTAREGVAWTFGLRPDEYRPVKQT